MEAGLLWNSRELDDPVQGAWGEIVHEAEDSVLEREALDKRVEIARGAACSARSRRTSTLGRTNPSVDEFADLVGSRSYVARLDEPERERILVRVRALAERLGEPVPFRYVTCVQVAKRL